MLPQFIQDLIHIGHPSPCQSFVAVIDWGWIEISQLEEPVKVGDALGKYPYSDSIVLAADYIWCEGDIPPGGGKTAKYYLDSGIRTFRHKSQLGAGYNLPKKKLELNAFHSKQLPLP